MLKSLNRCTSPWSEDTSSIRGHVDPESREPTLKIRYRPPDVAGIERQGPVPAAARFSIS
jgi:hypothetical protein